VNEVKGQLITERLNEREGTLSVWQRFAGFVGLVSRGGLHSEWHTECSASQRDRLITSVSDSKGEQWQTHSLTETQTGKATPLSTTFPALFLFL
jgi:hypothetical protein